MYKSLNFVFRKAIPHYYHIQEQLYYSPKPQPPTSSITTPYSNGGAFGSIIH